MCRSGHESPGAHQRRCTLSHSQRRLQDTVRLLGRHARNITAAPTPKKAKRSWARFMEHFDAYRAQTHTVEPPIPDAWPTRARDFTGDRLARMSDEELADAYTEHLSNDPLAAQMIEHELDRRDRVDQLASVPASVPRDLRLRMMQMNDLDLEAAAMDAARAGHPDAEPLLEELDRRERQWRTTERADRETAKQRAEMIAAARQVDDDPLLSPAKRSRAQGLPTRVDLQRQYDDFVYTNWLQAEADCNGALLNARGKAKHINPRALFKGNNLVAEAYASDELKAWWNAHGGRITFAAFTYDATGDARFREAAANAHIHTQYTDVAAA